MCSCHFIILLCSCCTHTNGLIQITVHCEHCHWFSKIRLNSWDLVSRGNRRASETHRGEDAVLRKYLPSCDITHNRILDRDLRTKVPSFASCSCCFKNTWESPITWRNGNETMSGASFWIRISPAARPK